MSIIFKTELKISPPDIILVWTSKNHQAENDRRWHSAKSTRRGGRQGTGRSGNKSSVWQHSVRNTPPRRTGVPLWQSHRRSGLATLSSVGAVP